MIMGWYYNKNNQRQPIWTNLPSFYHSVSHKPLQYDKNKEIVTYCGRDSRDILVFWDAVITVRK